MNVLWITNTILSSAAKRLNIQNTSGTWMESALENMKFQKSVKLSIASLAPVTTVNRFEDDGATFYCIPRCKKKIYQYNSSKCIKDWKYVINDSKPDIIMVWGTEYAHGLCAMKIAHGIPTVIVIQGILTSIQKYYLGGLSNRELKHALSLRNIMKRDSIRQKQKGFEKRNETERTMLQLAGNIIVENQWAKANCKTIAGNCTFYEFRQGINRLFFDLKWDYDQCVKNSIFCTAPVNYPLKGFHQIIKALAIVRKRYKDAVLRVPGMNNPFTCGFKEQLKQDGYIKYLKDLIRELDLQDSIVFLGRLDSKRIGEELMRANVFVVPSSIENISTSLREAMVVGTPAVASFVGGIPESIQDTFNGRLYRFEEYAQLADQIMELFANKDLSLRFSNNSRKTMRDYLSEKSDAATLTEIYKGILKK